MSLTLGLYLIAFGILLLLSFYRTTFGWALYLLTFFISPAFWWWGRTAGLGRGMHWNLIAAVVLLLSTGIGLLRSTDYPPIRTYAAPVVFAWLMALNATFVQFVLAPYPEVGYDNWDQLVKTVLLYCVMLVMIRSPKDFRAALLAISIIISYPVIQITLGARGGFSGGRFEGAGIPGAQSANQFANLMLTMLPLLGALFFFATTKLLKVVSAVAAAGTVNMLLLCNSRGAFLGAIAAGGAFTILAGGPARKKSLAALGLGVLAIFFLLGDPEIIDRFMTTFREEEQMDTSAADRLVFWQAGLRMVEDYPLGAGADAYKRVLSPYYLSLVGYRKDTSGRAVHNGYINDMTEYGVQGLFFRLMFLGTSGWLAYRTLRHRKRLGDGPRVILAAAMLSSLAGFAVACVFGDFIDSEWSYWLVAFMSRYASMYGPGAPETAETAVARAPVYDPLRSGASPAASAGPRLPRPSAPAPLPPPVARGAVRRTSR